MSPGSGPRIEPCGIPVEMGSVSDNTSPICTLLKPIRKVADQPV